MHEAGDDAPTAVENVPASQRSQEVALLADDHDPAAHGTHKGPVPPARYTVPGEHAYGTQTGALLPIGTAVPMGHASATHDDKPTALGAGDHVPSGQGVQSMAEMAPGA